MYKFFVFCLLILSLCACAETQSKNIEVNSQQNKGNPIATSTPLLSNNDENQSVLEKAIQTPIPRSNEQINESDYTVVKLNQNEMKKMTLAQQPQELIKLILDSNNENEEKPFGRTLKKINIRVKDYDLNHDGVDERIVIARLFSDESVPVIYIFNLKNKEWSDVIFEADLGQPESEKYNEIEFLVNKNKRDFDIIKLVDKYGSNENPLKTFEFFQIENGKYQNIQCVEIEAKTGRSTPCKDKITTS